MSFRFSRFSFLLGLLLCLGYQAQAQNAQLSGVIFDSSHAVIPRASVEITNQQTGEKIATHANATGLYSAVELKPGNYRVTASAAGFATDAVQNVILPVAGRVTVDFTLQPGATAETISVQGGDTAVNTTDATVSTVVDSQFVNNIPLNGRSFQSLITTVPGVTQVPITGIGESGEYTVNGQRTEENYFTVDGVAANTGAPTTTIGYGGGFSGTTPAATVLGTTQNLISVDALQEFRATTSTFSAQYGRTPGGQFEIISRSGTNRLHGETYDYFRNDALDANSAVNNYDGLPRVAERQNDFGGTIGGPVWLPHLYNGHDRTFFFYSYEGLRLHTPVPAVTNGVPSQELRNDPNINSQLRQIFNAYPVAPASADIAGTECSDPSCGTSTYPTLALFTASYSSPSQLDANGLRIDHSFSDRFKVFGRAAYTTSSISNRDPDNLSMITASKGRLKLITLGATNIFSARATNDLRFNITGNDIDSSYAFSNFGGATPLDLSSLPGFNSSQQDSFIFNFFYSVHARMGYQPAGTRQRQINAVDNFTTVFGRHSVRFGVDYRRLLTSESRPPLYEFAYALTPQEIITNSMTGIVAQKYFTSMRPVYENFSAYVQDEWKASDRLNLSMGLRWDLNPAPHDASGNNPFGITTANPITAQVAPANTPLWKTRYANFAPRFSLAYQVHRTPGQETVLRAGAGLYYDVATTTGSQGYSGLGSSATITPSGIAFPLTQAQLDSIPAPNTAVPYSASVYAFSPNLSAPYSLQWNAALEQNFGENQSLILSYVASAGHQLYLPKQYLPYYLGNTNFSPNSYLYLTRNGASSNYNSFQIRYNRRLSRGLQALASYTWSHSIDDATNNASVFEQLRSDSDYDIRNNFELSLTYDLPGSYRNPIAAAALKHWSVVSRVTARSAPPVDIIGYDAIGGGSGLQVTYHANRVPNQPMYLYGRQYLSGRIINPAAYVEALDSSGNPIEGDAGRNSARGYDDVEANFAVQRDFPFHNNFGMLFRMEAFNAFNHAIFGTVYNDLGYGPLFGTPVSTLNNTLGGLNPLYQTGGPRSLQAALKIHF